MSETESKDPIGSYVVVTEIPYASRRWNPGQVVEMPASRAKKFLEEMSIKPIAAPKKTTAKESN